MPSAARWSARSCVTDWPLRQMEPMRFDSNPIIAFISVDLPTPFRPIVATITTRQNFEVYPLQNIAASVSSKQILDAE